MTNRDEDAIKLLETLDIYSKLIKQNLKQNWFMLLRKFNHK